MQEFSSEKPEMSPEAYANDVRSWIAEAAEARRGPRKRVLAEIAREVGIHVRRVAAHFYSEVRSPSAAEYEQFRRWRENELRDIAAQRQRLELELEAITTRLNARGKWGNGQGVGILGGQVLGAADRQVVEANPVVRGEVEGRIEDPRQGRLLG